MNFPLKRYKSKMFSKYVRILASCMNYWVGLEGTDKLDQEIWGSNLIFYSSSWIIQTGIFIVWATLTPPDIL